MKTLINISGHAFPAEEISMVTRVESDWKGQGECKQICYRFTINFKDQRNFLWVSDWAPCIFSEPAATYKRAAEEARDRIIAAAWPEHTMVQIPTAHLEP